MLTPSLGMWHKMGSKAILAAIILVAFSCEKNSLKKHRLPEYDGILNWEQTTKKAEWGNRLDPEVAELNNSLYLVGGYNPGKTFGDPYYEDVWKSEDGTNWSLMTEDGPFLGRRGHGLVALNNSLYLIGGFSVNEESGERQYNNDVWQSADGITWKEIKANTKVPSGSSSDWVARMHHQCVVANNAIYIIGGYSMQDEGESRYAIKYLNDVWRSTDGINWTKLNNTDFGMRGEHAAVVDDLGNLYIQGGTAGAIFESPDSINEPIVDYYDLWQSADGETWTNSRNDEAVNEAYLRRAGHGLVYYRNRIWTLPGKTTSKTHYHFTEWNHFPIYTVNNSGQWETDSEGEAIDARHNYASIVFNDKIWVFGGNTNRKGQNNDIWAGSLD